MTVSPRVLRELPDPESDVLPGVKLELLLRSPTIASGDEVRARLRIHNKSAHEIRITTAPTLLAFIVLPETRSVVGAWSGHMAAVGTPLHLASGGGSSLDVLISANGGHRSAGEYGIEQEDSGLIPGIYGVIAQMPVHLPSAPRESHVRWSPEIPIQVMPRPKAWY